MAANPKTACNICILLKILIGTSYLYDENSLFFIAYVSLYSASMRHVYQQLNELSRYTCTNTDTA